MPASVYFRLDRDVTPIRDHVLAFNMEKGERKTKGGIMLLDDNGTNSGIRPRWCQVYKVGHENQDIEPGDWILVEHGRWTYGVDLTLDENGEEREIYLQRIDNDGILLVQKERPDID